MTVTQTQIARELGHSRKTDDPGDCLTGTKREIGLVKSRLDLIDEPSIARDVLGPADEPPQQRNPSQPAPILLVTICAKSTAEVSFD